MSPNFYLGSYLTSVVLKQLFKYVALLQEKIAKDRRAFKNLVNYLTDIFNTFLVEQKLKLIKFCN